MQKLIPMKKAQEMLGVSKMKMYEMVKEGVLSSVPNPLDKRQKLVPVNEVKRLRQQFAPLMAEEIDPEFYQDPDIRRLLRRDAEDALRRRAGGEEFTTLEQLQAELKRARKRVKQ